MKKTLLSLGIAAVFLTAFHSLRAQEKFQTMDGISVAENAVTVSLSGETKYHVFKITNPPRLIMEFSNTEHNVGQKVIDVNGPFIKRVRSSQFKDKPVKLARVVLDLESMTEYELKGKGKDVTLTLRTPGALKQETAKGEAKAVAAAPAAPAAAVVLASVKTGQAAEPQKENPAVKNDAAAPKEVAQSTAAAAVTAAAPKPKQTPAASKSKPNKKQKAKAVSTQIPEPALAVESLPAKAAPPAAVSAVKEEKKPAEIEVIAKPATPAEAAMPLVPAPVQKQPEAAPVAVNPAAPAAAVPAAKPQAPKVKAAVPAKPKKAKPEEPVPVVPQKMMLPKQLVNLDFEDADIRDVLRILSIKSGINIIYGGDVEGSLTVHLENVPFDKAFETILSLKGLVSQEQGTNILRIATPQKINDERAQAVTFTKIFALNYANAEEVKKNLDSIRTAEGRRGNIAIDARTNSLIITDTPEGLASAENIITELDKKPYQVIIEAKLLEVILTDNFDLGIQWQYASNAYADTNKSVSIGAVTASQSDSAMGDAAAMGATVLSVNSPSEGGTGVQFPADAVNGQIGAISFGLLIDNNRLSGILSALSQKGLSKLLSNPRVTTLNNQTAKILIGDKVPFTNTTIGAGGVSTTNTQWLEVGIKLEVNPIINVDQRITLKIKPEVSLVTRQTAAGPIISARQADTTVMIKNNETVVIGGLIREEDRKLGTQVPLLGELPIIGHLFRRDFSTKERTELLVFITPQIIE